MIGSIPSFNESPAMIESPLSAHFSLEEMVFSPVALRLGIINTPDAASIENLKRLCAEILEPARALLGVHLHVDSGYRSVLLNQHIGGAQDSAHLEGRAGDLKPIGLDIEAAFEALRQSVIPFDKLILECNAWLHIAVAPLRGQPRRQCLTASGSPGHWSYRLVA